MHKKCDDTSCGIMIYSDGYDDIYAEELREKTGYEITRSVDTTDDTLYICFTENGVFLSHGELTMMGDFNRLLPRIKKENLNGELLIKASRIKNNEKQVELFDATAGMGEDSFLLAAAGFNVILCEYDPIIAVLLKDSIKRASNDKNLSDIVARMKLIETDSIDYMRHGDVKPDVVYLDPMFPERQKSGLIKKKFQLIHRLERPCDNEGSLLDAAIALNPRKIVIKRPLKGNYLSDKKPNYSLSGKAIRYDCIVL